ncbi:indole-3-glycerol phosphate synthase TrpC [Caulobacter sp. S45]|uniref:indole-3-glycerol phosphate synthase TrpC n=1 Tax=Caulobacter sp. S45 TaxID=1641861 RepID=UPI001575D47D|nr:indole-3-glycerol phosphate synthase TrpC [Caulobacter sp. S45]
MTDILAHIAAYKHQDVAERKVRTPQGEIERLAVAARPARGFRAALAITHGLALIAEIKKASPSKGLIRADFDPSALASAYAEGGATCLSVLTDQPSFQGEDAYLAAAREAVGLPALRKDFLVDPWQVAESRALGADCILVILAMVDDGLASRLMLAARDFGLDVLVEVHDEAELARAVALGSDLIGVNNRDLRSFVTDLAVFERLAPLAPSSALLVAESGIATSADAVRLQVAGARALLVGESLMCQADVARATRRLMAS